MDYVPLFVANNFYRNRTEFKHEHVVYNNFTKFPKVDRYINVGRLARQRARLLVEMPYVRHTRRRHIEVPLWYDKDALDLVLKQRWHVYEERPLRDISEMFSVARKVVNSDPSRLAKVCELWEKHPKLIVFYNFDYELESLRSIGEFLGLSSQVMTSETLLSNGGPETSLRTPPPKKSLTTIGNSAGEIGECLGISGATPNPSKKNGSPSIKATSNESLQNASSEDVQPAVNRGARVISKEIDPRLVSRVTDTGSATTSTATSLRTAMSTRTAALRERGGETECLTKKSLKSEPHTSNRSSRQMTLTDSSTDKWGSTPAPPSSTSVAIAEWNGHKHQPVPSTDRWLYLVQYTAGAEAWECIDTDAMIFYSRNYSWKVWEQAQGRNDRLNTPFTDLWYYNFTSDSWVDRAIERSLRAKETFNEAKYVRIFVKE